MRDRFVFNCQSTGSMHTFIYECVYMYMTATDNEIHYYWVMCDYNIQQ